MGGLLSKTRPDAGEKSTRVSNSCLANIDFKEKQRLVSTFSFRPQHFNIE